MITKKLKETDLYPPLKAWLEAQDYCVRGEVGPCDLAAEKDGELVVAEMKLRPSLTLLVQAAERQEYADSVYVVLPVDSRNASPANRGFRRLLRRLGMGLIAIKFLKTKTQVEILIHPKTGDSGPRRQSRKKAVILREIAGRDMDMTPGGLVGGKPRVSAYRQRSIRIAVMLSQWGQSSPAKLKKQGAHASAGRILSQNFYGWFERTERGVYRLHSAGSKALETVPELVNLYRKQLTDKNDC